MRQRWWIVHLPRVSSLKSFLQKIAAVPVKPGPAAVPVFPEKWKVPTTPKRQEELKMWQAWKAGGEKPEHMEPLLQSLQPLVNNRIKSFRGVPIHREVLRSEANKKVIVGLQKFDPTKAQMHTFLTNELQGMQRFVQQHQNLSRITEERANKVGQYQRSFATLSEQFGREPTTQEIADHMKFSVKGVTKLQAELRPDILASGAMEDPFLNETPKSREILKLLPYELTPTEMQVFELLTGYGGKEKITSTGQIAKKLKWSDSKVAQTKTSIAKKIKQYL